MNDLPEIALQPISIKRTVVSGLLYSIFLNGFLYIGQLVIARTLSRADYAEFIVAINFVALAALIADLGLNSFFVRIFAEAHHARADREKKLGSAIGTVLFIRIVMSFLVVLFVLLAAPMFGYTGSTVSLMRIFVVSLFISSRLVVVRAVGEAYLRGTNRYRIYIRYAALDAAIFAAGTLVAAQYSDDPKTMMAIYTFSNVPGFFLIGRVMVKDILRQHLVLRIDMKIVRMIIRKGAPLILGCAFLTIHNSADPLILDKLSSQFDVSAFGASIRVLSALMFLPAVFSAIIAPEIVRFLSQENSAGAKALVHKAIKLLLSASAALALVLTTVPNLSIRLLYGDNKYPDIAPLIILLGWAFVGITYALFVTEIALAEGKQWLSVLYMFFSMVLSVSLDFILIPSYGVHGAVWSKCISVMAATIAIWQLSKNIHSIDYKYQNSFLLRFMFCIAIGLAIHYFCFLFDLTEITDGVLTVSAYLLSVHIFQLTDVKDFRSLIPAFKISK